MNKIMSFHDFTHKNLIWFTDYDESLNFFLAILGLDFNENFWNENNNICWHEKHLLQLDPLAKSYAKAFHNRSACFTCYVQALDKRVALTYEGQKLLSKTKSCEINFLLSLSASHFSVENGCVKQYLH